MPFLATQMLFHFDKNPLGLVPVFALVVSVLCWVAVERGLLSASPDRKALSALAPSFLLSLYLFSWVTGAIGSLFGIAHIGGWSRTFSAKECVALYILLAVASTTSVRVMRTSGKYFKIAGAIQLALSLSFLAREFNIVWQWYSWANQITAADGGEPLRFPLAAQWPAAAEFLRSAEAVRWS
jgi:hypothetical protein